MVVLDAKGALVAVVPFVFAVVAVLAGEAVLVVVDLTAVVGVAFFSAIGIINKMFINARCYPVIKSTALFLCSISRIVAL